MQASSGLVVYDGGRRNLRGAMAVKSACGFLFALSGMGSNGAPWSGLYWALPGLGPNGSSLVWALMRLPWSGPSWAFLGLGSTGPSLVWVLMGGLPLL